MLKVATNDTSTQLYAKHSKIKQWLLLFIRNYYN